MDVSREIKDYSSDAAGSDITCGVARILNIIYIIFHPALEQIDPLGTLGVNLFAFFHGSFLRCQGITMSAMREDVIFKVHTSLTQCFCKEEGVLQRNGTILSLIHISEPTRRS